MSVYLKTVASKEIISSVAKENHWYAGMIFKKLCNLECMCLNKDVRNTYIG